MSERSKIDVCLQLKTGSCLGCPILYEIYLAAHNGNKTTREAANEFDQKVCPPNVHPQIHLIEKGRIHSFGQTRKRGNR